jgi:hypothetical protein
MSLGGGRFGPPLKVERTEKHWKLPSLAVFLLKDMVRLMGTEYQCENIRLFNYYVNYLETPRFYGAEYFENNT